VFIEVVAKAAN